MNSNSIGPQSRYVAQHILMLCLSSCFTHRILNKYFFLHYKLSNSLSPTHCPNNKWSLTLHDTRFYKWKYSVDSIARIISIYYVFIYICNELNNLPKIIFFFDIKLVGYNWINHFAPKPAVMFGELHINSNKSTQKKCAKRALHLKIHVNYQRIHWINELGCNVELTLIQSQRFPMAKSRMSWIMANVALVDVSASYRFRSDQTVEKFTHSRVNTHTHHPDPVSHPIWYGKLC